MTERSKELLQLEEQNPTPLETTLLVCDNNYNNKKKKKESNTQTKRFPTAPLPPSQLLGKVKDFLGVMSEANKRLENDAKDHPEEYDIEELTGNESEVIEMDLMLGVADLHTPEAVAAAESAISGCQPVISLPADGSEIDSEEESSVDEDDEIDGNVDDCDYENTGKKPSSLDQKHTSDKDCDHEKKKGNRRSKKRPAIVELS
ncbi:hypothetical protein L195_g010764 [Trifolium pratense]|uniref:Uncharacterized protein n=3 Tax=Trifolium pratense TaxID=57577 RepID=A0A2K3PFM7_TRIPR|nr:myb-like protein V isoform X2 [Trifolium pratense]XP_045818480.1 myb-like protein V isoform X2 [Trifolium pratense]PNY14091.1 hypothetical protein L195_g010764 [Trifolium pratense]CAJ2668494.1 unnamed protein product [Trifolium pratense]